MEKIQQFLQYLATLPSAPTPDSFAGKTLITAHDMWMAGQVDTARNIIIYAPISDDIKRGVISYLENPQPIAPEPEPIMVTDSTPSELPPPEPISDTPDESLTNFESVPTASLDELMAQLANRSDLMAPAPEVPQTEQNTEAIQFPIETVVPTPEVSAEPQTETETVFTIDPDAITLEQPQTTSTDAPQSALFSAEPVITPIDTTPEPLPQPIITTHPTPEMPSIPIQAPEATETPEQSSKRALADIFGSSVIESVASAAAAETPADNPEIPGTPNDIIAAAAQTINTPDPRDKVFDKLFDTVHQELHPEPVAQDQIPAVIHTYDTTAETLAADGASYHQRQTNAEKAKEFFNRAEKYLEKAYDSGSPNLITSAERQLQNLIERYPEYEEFYPEHMTRIRDIQKNEGLVTASEATIGEYHILDGMRITSPTTTYTITKIQHGSMGHIFTFKDKAGKQYVIPEIDLVSALDTPATDPDTFFPGFERAAA